jgi:4-hydroxy-4-methyl-2-oxoglutarate aldolase
MTDESDEDLFREIRGRLFTAVVGDVMDAAGLARQFLPPGIKPLKPGTVVVGRAMPVLEADLGGEGAAPADSSQPFGLMFQALDDLAPDEVYICTGSSPRYALWGGLMSLRARALGAAGAVLDGFSRDTGEILELGFPVFSAGSYAQDQRLRGRVVDFRCPLEFANGARVAPGDIVFADGDGVAIIPRAQERDVVGMAIDKVSGENRVRQAIEQGMSAAAAFRKFGIM